MDGIIEKRQKLLIKSMKENRMENLLISKMENITYYSAFKGTFGYLYISKGIFYLITDGRYLEQAENQSVSCVIVRYEKSIEYVLKNISENMKKLYIEGYDISFDNYIKIKNAFVDLEIESAGTVVERARECKDSSETDIIKKAVYIADKAFSHILEYIKPGVSEKDVANELEYYMKKLGAQGRSFETIVASGYRTALPHGVASDKVIEQGDVVMLDYGAVYNNYCSDITRTVFVGNVDDKLKEIYEIVLKAQTCVAQQTKAGMDKKEVDGIARKVITDYGYGDNFVHSLGHGVGLEIHEAPTVSMLSTGKLLPGSIISNEPGIYIKGKGGIRIEDLMLVKEDGVEVLTQSSKEIIIL